MYYIPTFDLFVIYRTLRQRICVSQVVNMSLRRTAQSGMQLVLLVYPFVIIICDVVNFN